MTVKQLSVFVENKPGRLAEFADILSRKKIDLRALSIAETRDFGIVRVIVDDCDKAAAVLKEAGYVFSVTPVLAVAIPDEPGSFFRILSILGKNQINVEYTYAFITRNQDLAYMIFRVEDNDKAMAALSKEKVELLDQEDLRQL